jgi:hypothetical protein
LFKTVASEPYRDTSFDKEAFMQKWEYMTILRTRGWDSDKENPKGSWMVGTNWDVDIKMKLEELGEQGWELISVIPRSSYLGTRSYTGSDDFAGFTSDELWVFKRQK